MYLSPDQLSSAVASQGVVTPIHSVNSFVTKVKVAVKRSRRHGQTPNLVKITKLAYLVTELAGHWTTTVQPNGQVVGHSGFS